MNTESLLTRSLQEHPFSSEKNSDGKADAFLAPLPTHEQIAKRAYEIYERSGYEKGHCDENWARAQRELLNQAITNHARSGKRDPSETGSLDEDVWQR